MKWLPSASEAQLQNISKYVAENFTLCQCRHYIRADFESYKDADNKCFIQVCACGKPFTWHELRKVVPLDDDQKYLSTLTDTVKYPCNTFGKLLFVTGEGFDSSTIEPGASAFYIRLTPESHINNPTEYMENIYKLMTSKALWSLPAPHLIIEIAGSAQKMQHVDQEILDRFKSGLIKAANTAKAWIVTCGINVGVMGLVGDAVAKSRMTHSQSNLTCLGIANWCMINNREQLIISDAEVPKVKPTNGNIPEKGNFDIEMNDKKNKTNLEKYGFASKISTKNMMPNYTLERPENCEPGVSLNAGHNCFLFVDSGREKQLGDEIVFRAKFLHYLSRKILRRTGTRGLTTPLVLLVAGGGVETLKTVELSVASMLDEGETAVKTNISRPAIILPDFGGVSDLLAFAYEITAPPVESDQKLYRTTLQERSNNAEISHFPPDFDDRIRKNPAFEEILRFISEERRLVEGEDTIKRVRSCLKFRDMLTVVDLSSDNGYVSLDKAILNAVLKSNFGSPASTFELALLWGRVDVAKRLLMCHEKEISKQVDMKAAINLSLMDRQNEFFKLLVEYGLVDLHSYLTRYQIRTFYSDTFLKRRGKDGKTTCVSLFRSLLLNLTTEETLSDVANPQLLHLLGEILSSILGCYMDNVFTDEISYKQTVSNFSSLVADNDSQILPHTARDLCPYETSMRDFFILQLLLHRNDLAIYVWQRGHDHLGTALMAAIFLKSLSQEANRLDMTDLGKAYEECSREWRNRAINLLRSCYEQDPLICSRLLTRSLLTWQGATILEIAFYGNRKKFMEQPAVQTTLMQVWMGNLATFTRKWLVYLTLFPPLLPFLIFRIHFQKTPSTHSDFPAPIPMPEIPDGGNGGRKVALSKGQQAWLRFDAYMKAINRHDVKLKQAAIFRTNPEGHISVLTAIYLLYSSPIAKYVIHSMSCIVFLFLFSFFLFDESQENGSTSWLEFLIWISCIVFFLDVVRDGFGKTNLSVLERMEDFFRNISVLAEITGLSLVISAAALKISATKNYLVYRHTIYSIACLLYWLKSLRMFFVHESIGPTVIALLKMSRDLVFFVLLYLILLVSFSIPIYTLMYPRVHTRAVGSYFAMLCDICYELMWAIFFIGMDDMRRKAEGTCSREQSIANNFTISSLSYNETFNNPTSCSAENVMAKTLYLIFLLLTNIMLINMLTAMFAHTVDKTRLSATRLWRFDMYRFLYEYYTRPILPGPLMVFELIYRFVILIRRQTLASPILENTDLKHFFTNLDDYEYRKMEVFERSAAEVLLCEECGKQETPRYRRSYNKQH